MNSIKLSPENIECAWATYKKMKSNQSSSPTLDLTFNAWELNSGDLCGVALAIFDRLGLIEFIGATEEEMLSFISDVEAGYLCNPYHSFFHAVDVSIILYYFLVELDVARYLDQADILTLMVSGLCHDIGHPGVNNLYQVHAKTELAQAFEDISVLENHSCRLTANMLAKHQLFRKSGTKCSIPVPILEDWIVENILSTDMVHHFSLLEDLSHILDEWPSSPARSSFEDDPSNSCDNDMTVESFRRKLCELLLHSADISNAVRPWALCKTWSDMVVQEFFNQGDLEKRNDLPISPNMDRDSSNQPQIALDFDEFIVRPFFEILAQFIPECAVFLDNLEANRFRWSEIKKQVPQYHTDTISEDSPYNSRRVSFSAGTVMIPDFFCEELKRFSMDFTRVSGGGRRSFQRPISQIRYNRKREGCPPDKMNAFSSILKHSLSRMSSNDSIKSSLSLDRPKVS